MRHDEEAMKRECREQMTTYWMNETREGRVLGRLRSRENEGRAKVLEKVLKSMLDCYIDKNMEESMENLLEVINEYNDQYGIRCLRRSDFT